MTLNHTILIIPGLRDHVEQHRHQDERHRGLTAAAGRLRHAHSIR